MIGAGVFAVWGPAAQAGGAWLLAGLAIAAFVAFANAGSTGQLAARYPESGGAYRYGRERLGEWPGSSRAGDSWSARRPAARRWR